MNAETTTEGRRSSRLQLESQLGVGTWKRWPGDGDKTFTPPVHDSGLTPPAWWVSDEEASESFFQGMRLAQHRGPRR